MGRAIDRGGRIVAAATVTALLFSVLSMKSSAQTPTSTTTAPAGAGSPTGTATPTGVTATADAPKPNSITDTEYLSVQIDANGKPMQVGVKEWYRVRKEGGGDVSFTDPGVPADLSSTRGSKPKVGDDGMSLNVDVPDDGHRDVYIGGSLERGPEGTWKTSDGPKPLPIAVDIDYYVGEPGSDDAATQVNAREFSRHHGPFKIVITVKNLTTRTQEVQYNDVQTKKAMTAIAEVATPYSVTIADLELPDGDYDGLRSNGVLGRRGEGSVVNWTMYLASPDYPLEQHAIVQGLANAPPIPQIDVIAQPLYPEPTAEALTSSGVQFQKGRRAFYYDVLNLLRENLIALGGLFSVLDDSFSNVALPLIGPEKGNRDSGSFTDANLLWGVWTIAKGTEQLSRAVDDIGYSVQLVRNGLKGEIGTTQLLRSFIGKSTDKPFLSSPTALPPCLPNCSQAQLVAQVQPLLSESMWANLKDLEIMLGAPTDPGVAGGPNDPRPYLPEAPASLATNGAVIITVLKLKLAILEHNFYCLVYEDHTNECASILGITNKPGAEGWDKYQFVKYPFGQMELEKGLRAIETEGTDQIRQALGNKNQTNSFIWGARTIVEGVEALVDSFHQLGSTWRFIADSVQNFGIFGIETSRSILQLDINAIDVQSAARAAASRRALENNTFLGKPKGSQGQLVLAFSTDPETVERRSPRFVVLSVIALAALLFLGLLYARLKLFWI